MFVNRRMVTIVGTILLGVAWLLAFVTAGATGLEFLLKIRSRWQEQAQTTLTPRFTRLDQGYEPFGIQHLHPAVSLLFPARPRRESGHFQ